MTTVLNDLLAPTQLAPFMQNIWKLHFCPGSAVTGRYQKLCDWGVLNRILSEHRFLPPRLRLFKNGHQLDPYLFQRRQPPLLLFGDHLLRELQNGATLILDVIDEAHGPLRELATQLRVLFSAPVNVNLYAAWKTDHAFNVHFDPQENFIFQVHGNKRWKVWKPTCENPSVSEFLQNGVPDSPLVWDSILEDGGWLYIPRGWWHVACPLDIPSMHITVTITPVRTYDFLSWIVDQCKATSSGGQYIPVGNSKAHEDQKEYLCSLAEELKSKITADALDRFMLQKLKDSMLYPDLHLPELAPALSGPIGSQPTRSLSAS